MFWVRANESSHPRVHKGRITAAVGEGCSETKDTLVCSCLGVLGHKGTKSPCVLPISSQLAPKECGSPKYPAPFIHEGFQGPLPPHLDWESLREGFLYLRCLCLRPLASWGNLANKERSLSPHTCPALGCVTLLEHSQKLPVPASQRSPSPCSFS